jgi:hypothetical protein
MTHPDTRLIAAKSPGLERRRTVPATVVSTNHQRADPPNTPTSIVRVAA